MRNFSLRFDQVPYFSLCHAGILIETFFRLMVFRFDFNWNVLVSGIGWWFLNSVLVSVFSFRFLLRVRLRLRLSFFSFFFFAREPREDEFSEFYIFDFYTSIPEITCFNLPLIGLLVLGGAGCSSKYLVARSTID